MLTRTRQNRKRRGFLIARDIAWRKQFASFLALCGWYVSTSSSPPARRHGPFAFIVIHSPSRKPVAIDQVRRLVSQWDGTRVFIAEPDAISRRRAELIEAGATDVLHGHSGLREVLARIWRLCPPPDVVHATTRVGAITVDTTARTVWVHRKMVDLTPIEYRLLLYLARRPSVAISHEELYDKVLGVRDTIETSKLRAHWANLHDKLGAASAQLETVRPRQYRLVRQPNTPRSRS